MYYALHTQNVTYTTTRWFVRNQDEAHAVSGLVPLLNASKQIKKKTAFRDYNSFIFHTFWKKFLKPIKVCGTHCQCVCVCV